MSTTIGAVAIRKWHDERVGLTPLRRNLLEQGVAKGTVSKIITVLVALNDGKIKPEQVTSINHAYWLVLNPTTLPGLKRSIKSLSDQDLKTLIDWMTKTR